MLILLFLSGFTEACGERVLDMTWRQALTPGWFTLGAFAVLFLVLHVFGQHSRRRDASESIHALLQGQKPATPFLPKERDRLAQRGNEYAEPKPVVSDSRPRVDLSGVARVMFEHEVTRALEMVVALEEGQPYATEGRAMDRIEPIRVRLRGWGISSPPMPIGDGHQWRTFLRQLLGHVRAGTLDQMPTTRGQPSYRTGKQTRSKPRVVRTVVKT